MIASEIAGHARAVADGDVLQQRAHHLLAMLGFGRDADRIVGRFFRDQGRGLLAFDVDGAIGVLREGQPAQHRSFVIRCLAMHRPRRAVQRDVVRGDLHFVACRVGADVDIALGVVDVEGPRVELALPAR